MQIRNLMADSVAPAQGERFDVLLSHNNLVIERIVSSDAIVPFEYVQTQDEWVVLPQGEATIEISGDMHEMTSGDYVFLPAGMPHTVRRVSPSAVWLAVHLHPVPGGQLATDSSKDA